VTALGYTETGLRLCAAKRDKLEFTRRELDSHSGIVALFEGDLTYLTARWPRRDRDGGIIAGDFDVKRAITGLVSLCVNAGMWDVETPMRGRGIWCGPDNRLICHSGDQLRIGGGRDEIAQPGGR
jgi:hypothetical protein